MKDVIKETYTCDEAIEVVMQDECWERYKDEPTDYNLQFVLEDMYNIALQTGFIEGRHSMEEEWNKFSSIQNEMLATLDKLSKSLNQK